MAWLQFIQSGISPLESKTSTLATLNFLASNRRSFLGSVQYLAKIPNLSLCHPLRPLLKKQKICLCLEL